jgi:hypothetical protein
VIVDVFSYSGTFPQIAALARLVTIVQVIVVGLVQVGGRRRLTTYLRR